MRMGFAARLAALLLVTLPAFSQTYTPAKIIFAGGSTYSNAELLTASGLVPGKPLDKPAIEAAMQRLADPGVFSDITYTVDARALTFTLTPTPAKQQLPALYANFVMFDEGTLTPQVHARVPLFNGTVPVNGSMRQAVADTLTAVLTTKGIQGDVQSILGSGGRSVTYAISRPAVQVRALTVEPVSPAAAEEVGKVRQAYAAVDYDEHTKSSISDRLTQTYQDLGFLDAHVDAVTRSAPVITPALITVDMSAKVSDGGQYHVAVLSLPESKVVPSEELEKASLLKLNGPAGRVLVLGTTNHLEYEFTRRGYLDAVISKAEVKNAAAHTMAYTYTAVPGEVYHLKSFTTAGLTAEQQAEVNANWKLKPGDVYSSDYVNLFLLRGKNTLRSLAGYSGTYRTSADPNDHTVTLSITFTRGGKLQ